MDSRQAKEILMLYRPGRTDDADPQMIEAMDLARRDPELAAWLEQHCANYDAIRDKLKSIRVPPGLERRILTAHKKQEQPEASHGLRYLAAAAAIAIVIGVGLWVFNKPSDDTTLSHFRDRMVSTVLRDTYPMQMATNDHAQIREFFKARGAQSDYVISANLEKLPVIGGTVYQFNNHPVDLICLYDGVDVAGVTNKLWVFIADKSFVPGSPKPGHVEFTQVNTLRTASWTTSNNVYLLAAQGTRETLENYLK